MVKFKLAVLLMLSLASCAARADMPLESPAKAGSQSSNAPADRDSQLNQLNAQVLDQFKLGDYDKARNLLGQILAMDPQNPVAWYNMACVESRSGSPDKALGNLDKAVELGYLDFAGMERDEDLQPLRSLAGYKQLIQKKDQAQLRYAQQVRDSLAKQFGSQCRYEIDQDNKLIFATNIDQPTLDELKRALPEHAQGLWTDMFNHRPEQFITVAVPAPDPSAKDDPILGGGYYEHSKHMLIAHQIGMVLFHEFTHAMHAADQDALGQRHPIWILEGFSTFYESSQMVGGHLAPKPNNRLAVLQAYARMKKTIPLRQFLSYDQPRYMRECNVTYPESRYILAYLYDKGLLKKWYDTYTATYDQDSTAGLALEKVCGKKLENIESDWLAWVSRQEPPPSQVQVSKACLGVRTGAAVDGMLVNSVVPGSSADKAGIRPGDLLCSLEGQRTVDSCELVRLISAYEPGQQIAVKIRRGADYQTLTVTLTALPSGQKSTPDKRPVPNPPARAAAPARKAA